MKNETISNELTVSELSELCTTRLENLFSTVVRDVPSLDLKAAMEYTLSNGGKRLRPLLVYATGSIFKAPLENLDIAACAVELMHTYSLIHDDLPSMDNADLRRGKPSCHKMFKEAIAILTGDALQTFSLQLLAEYKAPLKADRRLQMVKVLANACGPYGMVAGQALDISMLQDESISNDLLITTYQLKTGALFNACIELGRLSSSDDDDVNQKALSEFGHCIGLAFQIQDDILDIESSTETAGKPQGIDSRNNKTTYAKRYGLTIAKEKVESLYEEALEAINYFGQKAQLLRELTAYILGRKLLF